MKTTVIVSVVAVIVIGAIVIFSLRGTKPNNVVAQNSAIVNGKQEVTIVAKGGYSPRTTTAKANTPTTLKIKTNGTFDCSSSIVISSIGYRKNLPSSGETLVDIPPQQPGTELRGTCGMGMYSFIIKFE